MQTRAPSDEAAVEPRTLLQAAGAARLMRVVITGATGNVGTSLLVRLTQDPSIEEIVGLARRPPQFRLPRTSWVSADVAHDDLTEHLRGADCVVHLAWSLQPSRDRPTSYAVNVVGSRRVFEAAAAAGVSSLIHASSVGAYSAGPKDRRVDELAHRWHPDLRVLVRQG